MSGGFSDVIVLVAQVFEPDENGIERVVSETQTELFCDVQSATRQEFAAAGQKGMKALYRVDVWAEDFSGQEVAIFDGRRLSIYRTYRNGDFLELYLGEKAGAGND